MFFAWLDCKISLILEIHKLIEFSLDRRLEYQCYHHVTLEKYIEYLTLTKSRNNVIQIVLDKIICKIFIVICKKI